MGKAKSTVRLRFNELVSYVLFVGDQTPSIRAAGGGWIGGLGTDAGEGLGVGLGEGIRSGREEGGADVGVNGGVAVIVAVSAGVGRDVGVSEGTEFTAYVMSNVLYSESNIRDTFCVVVEKYRSGFNQLLGRGGGL
jgi:hypothetical protein